MRIERVARVYSPLFGVQVGCGLRELWQCPEVARGDRGAAAGRQIERRSRRHHLLYLVNLSLFYILYTVYIYICI